MRCMCYNPAIMEDLLNASDRLSPALRRQLGSYYTPPAVVRYIVSRCLSQDNVPTPPRILDPACGDGMFLEGAAEQLIAGQTVSATTRLSVVRDSLFGVDLHAEAVSQARARLLEFIAPDTNELAENAKTILAANLRCGNSLTGEGFASIADLFSTVDEFSWREAFPKIAAEGGFDIVLGNPPYRRELDAKELFDTIAKTPLGKQWRQPRMDLWYYFLHRGLDLLKPQGLLSFIVGSYWTASSSARKMIARLEHETTLREVVLLEKQTVFNDVQGRHLIFLLQKPRTAVPCRIVTFKSDAPRDGTSLNGLQLLDQMTNGNISLPQITEYELSQVDLYSSGRLTLTEPIPQQALFEGCTALGELFETAQGMAENPPRINKRLLEILAGRCQLGEGVFVLTSVEIERLELNERERGLLRPYYETSALGRYRIPNSPSQQVLYLTRQTAPVIEELPNIHRHLSRFRAILEQRRETQKGLNAWWQLHWPRQERIFTEPAVLSIQMGKVPAFVFAEPPTFVGFSTNVILPKSPDRFSLAALTGILNSSLAAQWFARHAKRRGVNLEINLNVLRHFPLPQREVSLERQLAEAVLQRQLSCDSQAHQKIETQIDKIVIELYENAEGRHGKLQL